MFRNAINEVRFHPGRIIATLIAIAISVGFMSGVSTFITTQGDAIGKMSSIGLSTADIAVSNNAAPKDEKTTGDAITAKIKAVPGVEDAEQVINTFGVLTTDTESSQLYLYGAPGERFRWADLSSGEWPKGPNQVALSNQVADKLKVAVGDTVNLEDKKLTVSGITNDAPSLAFKTGYLDRAIVEKMVSSPIGTWAVATGQGADNAAIATKIHAAIAPLLIDPDVKDADGNTPLEVGAAADIRKSAAQGMTGEFDVIKYMLLVFSGIAALVGMIIIANTFTILLAQRRRQIGLLRAVGASGSQVRRQFLAEAVIIGALGSALGVLLGLGIGTLGAAYTKALYFGLTIPWRELAIEFAVGVVLTVLAGMLPSLRATRVAPLEALQPVATSEQVRKASIIRAVVCGLLVLAGGALAARALTMSSEAISSGNVATGPVASAVLGAMLLSVGILAGAELFIPTLLKVMGKVFGFGPTAKLAAGNSVRNPRRAAATATALMLAIGLIVTLQVGTATAEKTALTEIERTYPIDLSVATSAYAWSADGEAKPLNSLPTAVAAKVDAMGNVADRVKLTGGFVEGEFDQRNLVLLKDPAADQMGKLPTITDGQVLTGADNGTDAITLKGLGGKDVTLKPIKSNALGYDQYMVNQATLTKLVAKPALQGYWVQIKDMEQFGGNMMELQQLQASNTGINVDGSAIMSSMIKQVLNILLMVTTALLGVAVLIALIGVGNTLGLSVIERARESALLRALGMQKTSLRWMLLIEALMLALAGVIVGVLAGSFFGWLGVSAVLKQAGMASGPMFAINWVQTTGMVLIAVVAAALASLMPGRRAANATPTEALAEA